MDQSKNAELLDSLHRPLPKVQDLLREDSGTVPPELLQESYVDMGLGGVPATRYTTADFHRLEMERMWSQVWQMACRAEEIKDVGDHILYDIGKYSLIVVRTATDDIKAFYNVCRHRGRQLRDTGGKVAAFRCPYHGFTWNLDGTLKSVPCAWDFPHVVDSEFSLPEVLVDQWGGFVFINLNPKAAPLAAQLQDLPDTFRRWPLDQRYMGAYVSKELDCNWKIAIEAFIEAMHITDTHPQDASWIGDVYTQYDVWPGRRHYNRMVAPRGIASPSQGDLSDDEILQASEHTTQPLTVPAGSTVRREMAARKRAQLGKRDGRDYATVSDSEMIDTIQYFIFPNLVCWWANGSPIAYRFRPRGEDHASCIMDVYTLLPLPADRPRPDPAVRTPLGIAQPWTDAPELARFGSVFEQDSSNVGAVQKALSSGVLKEITLSRYQESRIRHFHKILGEYVGD